MKLSDLQPTVLPRSESKPIRLVAFIAAHLPTCDLAYGITVIARSASSPVVDALVHLGPELTRQGVRVRAIFTTLAPDGRAGLWSAATPELAFAREVRWASHPRLTEAHEQLVVAPNTCWQGDCMRRDPAKRDAYERFADHDPELTRVAAVSFERLWRVAEPVAMRASRGGPPALS